jgi:hypothetical protein
VTLKLLVVKVPRVTVTVPETVNASCSVTTPTPVTFVFKLGIVFPAEVKVTEVEPVILNDHPDVGVSVIAVTSVKLPVTFTLNPLALEKVPVKPVKFKFAALTVVPTDTVTAPDAASK